MMKKNQILKLLAALSISTVTLKVYASENGVPVNKFCFAGKERDAVALLRYPTDEDNIYSITKGEIFNGVDDSNDNCLYIKAQQKLDSTNHENIDWIKKYFSDNDIQWQASSFGSTENSQNDTPNALNFAVRVDIVYDFKDNNGDDKEYTCDNIIIAQGYNSWDGFNWWVASNSSDKPHAIQCSDQNENLAYLYMLGGQNTSTLKISTTQPKNINAAAGARFW